MRIVAVCGLGIGTSIILKMNAEKALGELGVDATVEAVSVAEIRRSGQDANIILTTPDLAEILVGFTAQIISIEHVFDKQVIKEKLEQALA
jgi:PTS system ascorbate-specific IIB component